MTTKQNKNKAKQQKSMQWA